MTMAKRPRRHRSPNDNELNEIWEEINKQREELDTLTKRVDALDEEAIKDERLVKIKKTCRPRDLKVLDVSSKAEKAGASAASRMKKMGK
jgi:hypothetical protein